MLVLILEGLNFIKNVYLVFFNKKNDLKINIKICTNN